MIFKEILEEKYKAVSGEIEKLIDTAFVKQSHNGDLLLVYVNGFYNEDVFKWNNTKEKFSPYSVGPNKEGHSEMLHYDFIDNYRKGGIVNLTFDEYKEKLVYSPEKREEIDELQNLEEMSIQLEMLIYLKIWESDSFIKRFYQIVRLLNGEPYDWNFKIAESSRDKNATGTRQEIIRKKIRNRLEKDFPILFGAIRKAYITQVRNSIAHSKYSFLGRNIHPNNFIEKDKSAQLRNVPFDEWIEIFHQTLAIYNGYIQAMNLIQKIYAEMSKVSKVTEVRAIEKKEVEFKKIMRLEFRPKWKDWKWEQNLRKK